MKSNLSLKNQIQSPESLPKSPSSFIDNELYQVFKLFQEEDRSLACHPDDDYIPSGTLPFS